MMTRRTSRAFLATIIALCAAGPAALPVRTQAPAAFDVVSITRNTAGTTRGGGLAAAQPGGRYVGVGVTLRRLIDDAYAPVDVIGGPSWLAEARFDITATVDNRDASPREIREALGPMLADRFNLAFHVEPRDHAVYLLTATRADRLGPRLTPSDAACAAAAARYFPAIAPVASPPCGDMRLSAGRLVARGMSMEGLGDALRGVAGRPIIDATQLAGVFDLDMSWSAVPASDGPPVASADDTLAGGVSLFTALREQLGLELQPRRAALSVLVIDRATMPTEN